MSIAGLWNGHDCSFCLIEDDEITVHAELERYNREKHPKGDAFSLLKEVSDKNKVESIKYFATSYPTKLLTQYSENFEEIKSIVEKNSGQVYVFPHHKCHAAHSFYSSSFDKAIVITFDGGGCESDDGLETACTIWAAKGLDMQLIKRFTPAEINIGGVWTRVIRYVFKLQNGWPRGGQEGSVMAMAALGDGDKYFEDFYKMLTVDKIQAGFKPANQPKGAYVEGKDPIHPYLDRWLKIAEKSEQDMFDLAASFQKATEHLIKEIIKMTMNAFPEFDHYCFSGGVALNTVAMGKIKKWFPDIKDLYIPPVPADSGLTIGAAQIVQHEILRKPRTYNNRNFCPYLGQDWTEKHLLDACDNHKHSVVVNSTNDNEVLELLNQQKIISVFHGKSESGRRALGNRSILADPRSLEIKQLINEKVKHRQWYRPFAPSILNEEVENWFTDYSKSAYMQVVLEVIPEKIEKIPAAVHVDGTARLQTVEKQDNLWYYNFLKQWFEKTGVPILLNTSFNDREPIVESPEHAILCLLKTNIDALYFPEFKKIIIRK